MQRAWIGGPLVLLVGFALVHCGETRATDAPDASTTNGGPGSIGGGIVVDPSTCDGGGIVHRPSAGACMHTPPVDGPPSGGLFTCTDATQCDIYGWRNPSCMSFDGGSTLYCNFDQCMSDSDCDAGSVCTCSGMYVFNTIANDCFPGNCRTDSDCPNGEACALSEGMGAGAGRFGESGWYCHSPSDICRSSCDCDPDNVCAYVKSSGVWGCGQGFAGRRVP